MTNLIFPPEKHIEEAEKNRQSALKHLTQLELAELADDQRKLLNSALIMLIGLGVQLKLASEKLGGTK
jgi:hypothetical protein